MELTLETLLKAKKILEASESIPKQHSNEGLKRRIIFCGGLPKAIVRAWGYVYVMDDVMIDAHETVGWKAWGDKRIHKWVDQQLKEQL